MYIKVQFLNNAIMSSKVNVNKMDLEDYYKELNCRTIDIVNLNEDIAIICDDEGLLVSDNPVFEIEDGQGNQRQIAGVFIIAKDVMTEDGPEAVGFEDISELEKLIGEFKISIIGITR